MTLRRTEIAKISSKRLAQFNGHTPRSSLDKPGQPRTQAKPKRPADTGPDEATVKAVLKRADGRCESCGDELHGRRGIEYSIHHRKRRSQGGDNRLSNLVALCGHGTSGCHGACHSEIAQARLAGFLILSTEDSAEIPVDLARGSSLLTNDGEAVAIPALREEPDGQPF
jgi:hypothetical protein